MRIKTGIKAADNVTYWRTDRHRCRIVRFPEQITPTNVCTTTFPGTEQLMKDNILNVAVDRRLKIGVHT